MTPQDNSDATNSDATINTMQQQFDIMRTASRQDQYVDWSIRSARLKARTAGDGQPKRDYHRYSCRLWTAPSG